MNRTVTMRSVAFAKGRRTGWEDLPVVPGPRRAVDHAERPCRGSGCNRHARTWSDRRAAMERSTRAARFLKKAMA